MLARKKESENQRKIERREGGYTSLIHHCCYIILFYSFLYVCGPHKGRLFRPCKTDNLFRSRVFGDGFGSFTDSVLGQFSRKEKANSSLHLATAYGRFLVVLRESGCFCGNSFEDVVDEAVHNWHSTAWNASVGVDLFEHLVDVDTVALPPTPVPLLATTWPRSFRRLLWTFLCDLTGRSHDADREENERFL